MGRSDDGEVEWLDVGPSLSPDGNRQRPWRWRWWYPLLVLAVGALVLADVQHHDGGKHPSAAKSSSSASKSSSAAPTPASSATPGQAPPTAPQDVTVVDTGHPLLDVPGNWELFGYGPGDVVRIQFASGRITTTIIASLDSTGPVSFVVAAGVAFVRPLDNVPGYAVRDGQPAALLSAPFDHGGPLLPGPDLSQVWVISANGASMNLVGVDGSSAHASIPVPADAYPSTPDGTGYPILTGTGGAYDARPGGDQRITSGTLVAVGPTRWLTVDCDAHFHCATTVTDRVTGIQHQLPTPPTTFAPEDGVISPDGTTAAVLEPAFNGTARVDLIDLTTGADRPTRLDIDVGADTGPASFVWTPDSRFLFVADGNPTPAMVARTTGALTRLDVPGSAALDQIVLRVD